VCPTLFMTGTPPRFPYPKDKPPKSDMGLGDLFFIPHLSLKMIN